MRIDAVDFFYLSMPVVEDRGDGSQDALLVRVRSGELHGWGECEAAPLVSIASWCCPMSHSACHPVKDSVLGETLDGPEDIARIGARVRRRSFDLLQTDHTLSGIDIALWDLLGKGRGEPVWRLLGYDRAFPKRPYASVLFGDTPSATHAKAAEIARSGYRAAKFGWGPFGAGTIADDEAQVHAARRGLGSGLELLVDAGTIFDDDVERAARVLPVLEECEVVWFEEPFASSALEAYHELSKRTRRVRLAAGEGAHDEHGARHLIDYGGIGFVQIDAGRIGGITTATRVAKYAASRSVTFVNHTFTTQLALSASIQPYAGLEAHEICEYPVEPTPLARDLFPVLERNANGDVILSDRPGLGLEPHLDVLRRYLVPLEITVRGERVYETPGI
jgi:L-alanine-DL-glutamate epimerase-like enolase superfamily enzyme